MSRIALIVALCIAAFCVQAQEAEKEVDARKADNTTTLDTITVTAPRPPTLDLYKFKNPVEVQGSAFDKRYHEPPTPEEISSMPMGYIGYGINYVLGKAFGQVTKLPGWKDQVQSATARPPPLDDDQMERAARMLETPSLLTDSTIFSPDEQGEGEPSP